jgi:hypothetical protein
MTFWNDNTQISCFINSIGIYMPYRVDSTYRRNRAEVSWTEKPGLVSCPYLQMPTGAHEDVMSFIVMVEYHGVTEHTVHAED